MAGFQSFSLIRWTRNSEHANFATSVAGIPTQAEFRYHINPGNVIRNLGHVKKIRVKSCGKPLNPNNDLILLIEPNTKPIPGHASAKHKAHNMNLTELKQKPIVELQTLANEMGLEGVARSRKQDVIFSILKAHAKNGESIYGAGVLEILQDGFGFLRSADCSYLAGPDDIYVSPSHIKVFGLKTGDTVHGAIRPPKEGDKYFALLKVESINSRSPEEVRDRVPFEYLTPLFPHDPFDLFTDAGNFSTRMIDLFTPIGKGQRGGSVLQL